MVRLSATITAIRAMKVYSDQMSRRPYPVDQGHRDRHDRPAAPSERRLSVRGHEFHARNATEHRPTAIERVLESFNTNIEELHFLRDRLKGCAQRLALSGSDHTWMQSL